MQIFGVSLRQAAEWGMRGLEGTFGRLKTRLSSNHLKRKLIILSCLYLHNFRVHNMGINQVNAVF